MARDDFPERVRRLVAERAGHCCSFPSCRASTTGPASGHGGSVRLGEAAHITAASPGGPRHDPSMSPNRRKAVTNAIWLCRNHAKLIDSDAFSVEYLNMIKASAEAEAARTLGRVRTDGLMFSSVAIRQDLCAWDPAHRFRGTSVAFGFHIIPDRFLTEAQRPPATHSGDPIFDVTLVNSGAAPVVVSNVGLHIIRTWTSLKGIPQATSILSLGDYVLPIDSAAAGDDISIRFPNPFHVPSGAPLRFGLQLAGYVTALQEHGNESEVAIYVVAAASRVVSWPIYLGVY